MKKLLLSFSLLTFSFSLLTAQQSWQMTHGNAQRSGYANAVGPQTGNLLWKYKLGYNMGAGENSIAVSGTGILYVGGTNKIVALNRKGDSLWSTGKYTGAQGPCISNTGKYVYFVADSAVVCFDSIGAYQWSYIMGGTGIFGPTLSADGSTIYQGCWDHYVYAINTSTHLLKWKFLTHGAVSYCSALTPGGSIIVGGGDAHHGTDSCIYSLNSLTGDTNWTYHSSGKGGHWGGPVIGKDGLIYATQGAQVYAFDTATGKIKWTIGGPPNIAGLVVGLYDQTAAAKTLIYSGVSNNWFYAIQSTTGTFADSLWAYHTGNNPGVGNLTGIPAFPVVDNKGDVYFGGVDHKVYGLNNLGDTLWTYKTGGEITEASPALDPATGTLYVTSQDGYVYAFGTSTTTGVNNEQASAIGINVFPNPGKGIFTISNIEQGMSNIEVYNMLGEKVYSSFIIQNLKFKIDLSGLANGVYTLRVQLPDGSVANKKIEVLR